MYKIKKKKRSQKGESFYI